MQYIVITTQTNFKAIALQRFCESNGIAVQTKPIVETRKPTNDDVMKTAFEAVCLYFNVNPTETKSKNRKAELAYARNIFTYIVLRTNHRIPLKAIGAFLSGRHYSSIIYGRDEILNQTRGKETPYSKKVKNDIKNIIAMLQW